MLKKALVLSLSVMGVCGSGAAFAANAVKCSPPVVNVQSKANSAQYTITCEGTANVTLTPKITFSGDVFTVGTPPYDVTASYILDVRPLLSRIPGEDVRSDQIAAGSFNTSAVSVAALPSQFASQVEWDAQSGALALEEKPGLWHIYALKLVDKDARLSDAGYASEPVKKGQTRAKVVLGKTISRFAGVADATPLVHAVLGLRDGKLEVLMAETVVASQDDLQAALLLLDKKPKDMSRAWSLAARAKFVGNDNLVRYAEQKVAANNPQLLTEFQETLQRVKPFEITK